MRLPRLSRATSREGSRVAARAPVAIPKFHKWWSESGCALSFATTCCWLEASSPLRVKAGGIDVVELRGMHMRAGIELVHPYRAAQARSRRPETEEEMEDGARGTEGRIKRRGGRGTIRGRSARPRENGVPWTESRATPRPTVTQQRHAQATTNTKKATRKKHQRSTPPVERGNRKATPEAQAREEEEERWRLQSAAALVTAWIGRCRVPPTRLEVHWTCMCTTP